MTDIQKALRKVHVTNPADANIIGRLVRRDKLHEAQLGAQERSWGLELTFQHGPAEAMAELATAIWRHREAIGDEVI